MRHSSVRSWPSQTSVRSPCSVRPKAMGLEWSVIAGLDPAISCRLERDAGSFRASGHWSAGPGHDGLKWKSAVLEDMRCSAFLFTHQKKVSVMGMNRGSRCARSARPKGRTVPLSRNATCLFGQPSIRPLARNKAACPNRTSAPKQSRITSNMILPPGGFAGARVLGWVPGDGKNVAPRTVGLPCGTVQAGIRIS